MVVAFMSYGGLGFLLVSGRLEEYAPGGHGLVFGGLVSILSLASWFFLFWWYPVLQRTEEATRGDPGRAWIGRALEVFAVSCVVLVHVLLAIIVLTLARA